MLSPTNATEMIPGSSFVFLYFFSFVFLGGGSVVLETQHNLDKLKSY